MSCRGILAGVALFTLGVAYGVEGTWTGGNIGRWSDPANWQDGLVPSRAGDTASFTNAYALTAVTLDADVALDRIDVANTRLNLYSQEGRTLSFAGDAPEIAVDGKAMLRASGVKLAASVPVRKSGAGGFTTVGRAAEGLKLAREAGTVGLEGTARETVTVPAGTADWQSQAHALTGAEVASVSPLGPETGSLVVGHTVSTRTGVTGCRRPIKVDTSFTFSADVEMTGSSAYGFTVAFHNDPRGHLAHSVHAGEYTDSLGYGATSSSSQAVKDTRVRSGFGFGIYNLYYGDGRIRWGTDGTWQGNVDTDPLIYTATGAKDASDNYWTRWYSLRISYDADLGRATLTLIQDQREIVEGGQADVTYTKTVDNVDLVALCGSDEAFLSLTYSEGGRNILATLRNVRLEYAASAAKRIAVSPGAGLWSNRKCASGTLNDVATGISPYGAQAGSIRIGYGIGMQGTVTGRSRRVPVTGDFEISGKVTDNGSGAHGYAVVLHNDPRGCLAHCMPDTGGSTIGYARAGNGSITKSVAFGILNYAPKNGMVGFGRNGAWSSWTRTAPKIVTAPRGDNHANTEVRRTYDFRASFDATAKTLTLVLSQEQDGAVVTSTHVYPDVDVPALCGDTQAYLTLVSEAGGCSVDVTIDDFLLEYAPSAPDTAAHPFFDTFEEKAAEGLVSVSEQGTEASVALAGTTAFAAGTRLSVQGCNGACSLGTASAAGDMALASGPKPVTVDAAAGQWANRKCAHSTMDDLETGISPYGAQAGSIRIGYGIAMQGTVTGCSRPVSVTGNFRISGKVTDNGTGAHGYSVVLHNDPRGCLAHCMPDTGGSSLGYARGASGSVMKSVAFGVYDYAGNNGRVRFGKGGEWMSSQLTSPKIVTAPRGDSHSANTPVPRQYDFSASFDAAAKTLTLVLSQVQEGVVAASTNVWSDVDVPTLCGDGEALLTLTSEAGGASVDVTIDDFRIDYAVPGRAVYSAEGPVTAPARSVFTLDDAVFTVGENRQLAFDAYDLRAGAAFAFDGPQRLAPVSATRNGVQLKNGTYTAAMCDWVVGPGEVSVTGRSTLIIFR